MLDAEQGGTKEMGLYLPAMRDIGGGEVYHFIFYRGTDNEKFGVLMGGILWQYSGRPDIWRHSMR